VGSRPKSEKPRSEKTAVFRFLAGVLVPLFELMMKFVIVDGDKIPRSGAFVLSPNHLTNLDPVIVGRVLWKLGRAPRFLAKASLFGVPFLGWLLRKSGQVPVQRTGAVRGSDPLAAGESIAQKGLAVVVYPEGSLTRDPEFWPMRGKYGAVRMALEVGVPLIPAAHWGDQKILPPSGGFHPFPRKTVTVKFGDPVDLSKFAGRQVDTVVLQEATALLMQAITDLLGELRGETPSAERWDPVAHGQSEIGKF
jgi:1-acyl-sn-glycerol-3-phosphate acyltransferase